VLKLAQVRFANRPTGQSANWPIGQLANRSALGSHQNNPVQEQQLMKIQTIADLRQLYAAPQGRAVQKEIQHLDVHCRSFIALSPFLMLATTDDQHQLDASPRGGEPGFAKVIDAQTLLIPDAPGNNRLDSLENIINTGKVGVLFLIPGFDETLRINGSASLSQSPADIAICSTEQRAPKLVIRVSVQAAYLHCAKALMRSKLWDPAALVARSTLPTIGKMIADQTGLQIAPETQEEMVKRYAPDL
jgi:PPOX class probable FMN-dependent enzyme